MHSILTRACLPPRFPLMSPFFTRFASLFGGVRLKKQGEKVKQDKKQVLVMPPKTWSYTGETGPSNWAKLDPVFKTCGKFLAFSVNNAALACAPVKGEL